MKRLLTVLLAGLLVAAFALPACAWEFSTTGEYEYRMIYIGRTGNTDLFGNAALQDQNDGLTHPRVGLAGPNIYNLGAVPAFYSDGSGVEWPAGNPGMTITRSGYSQWDSDVLWNDSRLTLVPAFRVNPAIRVHGVYTIGGMRHKYFQNRDTFADNIGTPPLERYYMHQTSHAAYNTAAIGSWEQFRATIQTPYGIWSIGVKDFPLGTGANLSYATRAESFLWVLPYGPFRLLWPLWLARGNVESFQTTPDQRNVLMTGWGFTYDCGPLSVGGGFPLIWRVQHRNAQQAPVSAAARASLGLAGQTGVGGQDSILQVFGGYMKYNNGRFFAAAEYFWLTIDNYNIGNRETHIEGYNFFSEVGGVAGPAKLRVMYALSSGPVLNNDNATKAYTPNTVLYQALNPYQFLIFQTYGGGNNAFNAAGLATDTYGGLNDGYVFAGRLDYAIASNLNIWGSYLWAHRLERGGTVVGQYGLNGPLSPVTQRAAIRQFQIQNGFTPPALVGTGFVQVPGLAYVPDGYLGWEAGAGLDWKLLEGLNMHVSYHYWQPGDWFTYAYQAVGATTTGADNLTAQIIGGRDAINAIRGSFVINF